MDGRSEGGKVLSEGEVMEEKASGREEMTLRRWSDEEVRFGRRLKTNPSDSIVFLSLSLTYSEVGFARFILLSVPGVNLHTHP